MESITDNTVLIEDGKSKGRREPLRGFLPAPEGQLEALSEAPLVTNTELSTTCESLNRLKPPSPLAFASFSPHSKRYVLQSVIKEILDACEPPVIAEDGKITKTKYYRLGACKQLSTVFNPNNWHGSKRDLYDVFRQFGAEIEQNISMASIKYREKEAGGIEAHFGGLCRCDGVWVCPVCGPVVAEYRAKEIAQAMYLHQKAGGWVVFVTFTVRHKKRHEIKETLRCVSKSLASTKNGNQWKLFKDRTGLIGTIRAPEYTYTSSNGHHPHVHELWFFEDRPNLKEIKDWVFNRYCKFVVKHEGFDAPSKKRGVDMRLCLASNQTIDVNDVFDTNNIESISSYISKGADVDKTLDEAVNNRQWGAPEEMTKNQYKKTILADKGGEISSYNSIALAMEYMLAQYELSECMEHCPDDKEAVKAIRKRLFLFKKLYRDYADAFFGSQQLRWSDGLKDRFDIYEMKDKEINETFENELEELMSLDVKHLQKIVKFRLKGKILDIVENEKYTTNIERIKAVESFLGSGLVRVNRYG